MIGVFGGREIEQAFEVTGCCTSYRELEGTRFEAEAEIKTVSDLLDRDVIDRVAPIRTPGQETLLTEPTACLAHRYPTGAVKRRQLLFRQ